MPLTSDLKLDASKLDPKAISQQTHDNNEKLIRLGGSGPKWYEVGAAKHRQMRWDGELGLPRPTLLDSGKDITLPSREKGRSISCRVFEPETGKAKGVFYHIHGGGWVLQSQYYQDSMLKYIADETQLTVVSPGYRLAPEDPYPAANEDCFDIGEWLVDNAEKEFGGPLHFVGGDSAGGHLSVVTTFHLLEARPDFAFKGIVLNFGVYNVSALLPQTDHFDQPLILTVDILQKYIEAYLPNTTLEERRSMWISPFYADLRKLKLPPALFQCGTLDCLLDDTVLMSTKWMMSGAEATLKLYPGAPHGFIFMPPGGTERTQEGLEAIRTFVTERL